MVWFGLVWFVLLFVFSIEKKQVVHVSRQAGRQAHLLLGRRGQSGGNVVYSLFKERLSTAPEKAVWLVVSGRRGGGGVD